MHGKRQVFTKIFSKTQSSDFSISHAGVNSYDTVICKKRQCRVVGGSWRETDD